MHSKTVCFNTTVLKKDLTRFLPLWAIYLILGVLLFASNWSVFYYYNASDMADSLSGISIAMCLYAMLSSQLLFGDLFQSRMCNAIHALPVRREGLFLSHFTAGMIMGIGPNVIIALICMLGMGRLWFVALLWLGAVSMMYLLFFGIGVFCIMCSGNRFGAVALYALINLLGVIVLWFFEAMYLHMLYGMEMNDAMRDIFYIFSPVVRMAEEYSWIDITHLKDICTADHDLLDKGFMLDTSQCIYGVTGYSQLWPYLGILVPIGLAFSAGALLLYRKRHLESAGDFLAVKPVGILFTLVAGTCVGGLCYYIAADTFIGMAVGLVVGFFVCRMLLERTVKVFGKKNWLQLIAFCLVVALSFGLTYFDVFGVASRVPDTEDIQSVTFANRYLSEWELESLDVQAAQPESQVVTVGVDPYYAYGKEGQLTLTEGKDIDVIREVHRLLIQEGDAHQTEDYSNISTVTIHYVLKNGSTMTRYYYTANKSEAMKRLASYIALPQFVLGFENPDEMVKNLKHVSVYDSRENREIEDPQWLEKLLNALFEDATAGNLHHEGKDFVFELQLDFEYEDGRYSGQYIYITEKATSTVQWLKEYKAWLEENEAAAV